MPSQCSPLGPNCSYDLSGNYQRWPRRQLQCPKCGALFMSDDVGRTQSNGDWLLAIGLRRLTISLVIRTVVVTALFVAFVWVIELLVASLMQSGMASIAGRIAFWPNIPLGAIVGFAMAYRLCDAAGLESWWFAIAGVIAIVVGAAVARFCLSTLFVPPTIDPGAPIFYQTVGAIMFSLWWHYFKNT